jgi:hypothetical protein
MRENGSTDGNFASETYVIEADLVQLLETSGSGPEQVVVAALAKQYALHFVPPRRLVCYVRDFQATPTQVSPTPIVMQQLLRTHGRGAPIKGPQFSIQVAARAH